MPVLHTCFQAKDVAQQTGDITSDAFSLYVSAPEENLVGQPLLVSVTALNVSEKAQNVRFDPLLFTLSLQEAGKAVPYSSKQRIALGLLQEGEEPTYSGPIVTKPIQPGAPVTRQIDLSKYFQITAPGTYSLCASFGQAHLAAVRTIKLTNNRSQ